MSAILPAVLTAADNARDGDENTVARYHGAVEMAKVYVEATQKIAQLMERIEFETKRIREVFEPGEEWFDPFGIGFRYDGREWSATDAEKMFALMKRRAWRILIEKLGLRNIMSVKRRAEVDRQIKEGECPEITEDSIIDVLMGLAEQASDFATEAAKEVFEILRPHNSGYKTNDAFRVGRKVILTWFVERAYYNTPFRPNYHREQHLIAIDGIFHLLDGKGVMRQHQGPLVTAIKASRDGTGETEYFKFKCYKNSNLHLEFKRLDLVQQLNLLAVGERVLGEDGKEGE
jgi:hypothetical protein